MNELIDTRGQLIKDTQRVAARLKELDRLEFDIKSERQEREKQYEELKKKWAVI